MKQLKMTIVVLAVLLITACTREVYIPLHEIDKASKFCDNNGGVKYFVSEGGRILIPVLQGIECNNGATFKIKKSDLYSEVGTK
mgnify:CR=1 FL=1